MRKLAEFTAFGLEAVPWSVPTFGSGTTKSGKPYRFSRRSKKSRLAEGRGSLEDWQKFIRNAADEAFGGAGPFTGPCRVHMEFYACTPEGRRDGDLWDAWSEPDEDGGYRKASARKRPEPDLVNLFKGAEDAIQESIVANDIQDRWISAVALYGPFDGVRVVVYAIEPGDFPGTRNELQE